jgi:ubiquinol-cytochrome c reductase cytochrome c1 subunit
MTLRFGIKALGGAAIALSLGASATLAAGDAIHVERRAWTFGGINGYFNNNQLQRGFQVYKEVCSSCHGMKRIAFRNLADPSGPAFPEDGTKNLAATYQIVDGPNDQGKMFKRPGRLSDYLPSPFSNEQEARSVNNGALPPDLSVMAKARGAEVDRPFYAVPGGMLKDIITGYQEGGADYIYALLTGYGKEPAGMKMSDGMNYNAYFPGYQIAMAQPLNAGQVKYTDGSPATVAQYAEDVTAFIAWASDPTLEDRKRIGKMVLIYLLITSVLLYFAKKRLWAKIPH